MTTIYAGWYKSDLSPTLAVLSNGARALYIRRTGRRVTVEEYRANGSVVAWRSLADAVRGA